MTELELRKAYVDVIISWLGYSKSNGKHKKIIDIYNAHTPLAQGYKVKYTDAWCATTVSAAAIQLGITDIIPTECSCSRMITLYRKLGRWVENDAYVPSIGDLIMYDWDDNGIGDCTGAPEHVGAVVSVSKTTIKVIEGNKSNVVAHREIPINGKFIRGFCTPDFATKAKSMKSTTTNSTITNATIVKKVSVELPVIQMGSKCRSVGVLQKLLGFAGKDVDNDCGNNTVNAIKKYQTSVGLKDDGVCGKDTWTSILN